MITAHSGLGTTEKQPILSEQDRTSVVQSKAETETPQHTSHTLEYMSPTHDELSFASKLVSEVEQTTLVSSCHKLMEDSGDLYIAEHSYRVAIAGVILGSRLGLSREELLLTATAAECHDIGRLDLEIQSVVSSRERYKGSAREKAMKVIKRHVVVSAGIIRAYAGQSTNNEAVAEMVEAHHSYSTVDPYGARPSQFETAAEVMAFADELDALASTRSYKPAMTKAETRHILENQFDSSLGLATICFEPSTQS